MGNNWPRVKVSEVCELIVDCVNKTAPVSPVPTPYKMIRTPNIKNGKVSTDDCRYVDADTFAKWTRRATVNCYDVLLTREAPLGEVGIVNSSENLFLGQRVMQYRADKTKLDAHFLLYSFLSPALQHQFSMHEGSGSVVSHIRVGDCSKFELSLPPLDLQKRIAGILRNLDNKITLNQKTNQTLEQMAQALFKSWFVDFDPVVDNALDAGFFEQNIAFPDELLRRAEARRAVREHDDFKQLPEATRQLFPAAFEECSEPSLGLGGWLPQGWKIAMLDEITCELRRGVSPKYVEEGGVQVINQKCIRNHEVSYEPARRHDHEAKKIDGRELCIGDVLVNSTGVGTLGRIAQVTHLPETTVVDSHVTVVRVKDDVCPIYTFGQLMLSMEGKIEQLGEGSTGQTELSRKIL